MILYYDPGRGTGSYKNVLFIYLLKSNGHMGYISEVTPFSFNLGPYIRNTLSS